MNAVVHETKIMLAQSLTYYINSDFETVWLHRRDGAMHRVIIGDFYGDPKAAIIDEAEQWCIVVGCGAIVYYIERPFPDYEYNNSKSAHWIDVHRDPEALLWFDTVEQIGSYAVKVTSMTEGSITDERVITIPPFSERSREKRRRV